MFPVAEKPIKRKDEQYAAILKACGLKYPWLDKGDRQTVAKMATRLRSLGWTGERIGREGGHMHAVLGRRPTLRELGTRLLGD